MGLCQKPLKHRPQGQLQAPAFRHGDYDDLQGLNNELQDKYKALIVRDAEIITYINSLSTAYDILRKKHNELSIIWASKFIEDKERKKEYKKQWDEKNKKKVNKKTTK